MNAQSPSWKVYRLSAGVSLRFDPRVPWVLGALLVATLAVLAIYISVGEYPIPLADVFGTLLGRAEGVRYEFVILQLRLPRALLAWLVGAALATSGGIIQGLTRNPLASPDLTGVTAGASAAAVTLIILLPFVPSSVLPLAAFGGGLLVAALLYLLAWRNSGEAGGDSPIRLILIGIGLSAVMGAYTSYALTFGDLWHVQKAMMWLTGSVYAASWSDVAAVLPWIVVCLPLAAFSARDLNALNLGQEVAQGLGLPLTFKRGFLLLLAVALAAITVTVAGIIGFVGLIAPHAARRLVGPLYEGVIPTCALAGGFLVLLADLVGRTLFSPTEIPAGIIIALVGVPFFLYLLWKREKI